jgi:hypothetical protein
MNTGPRRSRCPHRHAPRRRRGGSKSSLRNLRNTHFWGRAERAVTDDRPQQLAERVVEHLEQSGFEVDEAEQVIGSARRARTEDERGSAVS